MKRFLSQAVTFLTTFLVANMAFASEGTSAFSDGAGYIAIGSGLAVGLAALGGGIGQGNAANGALGGIARNPGASGKVFTPMIIGLAMTESLVLLGFVIAFFLQNNLSG